MKKIRNKKAFTLIELLVVVAIISALVGILSVAQRKVKIVAKNLRQKAAFHAGEISVELFSKDFEGYPDSKLVSEGGKDVTGAQRLAEALFGRDDQGYHPKSKWHPLKDATAGLPHPGADLYDADVTLKDRKVPYFERKRAGFYTIYDLWAGNTTPSTIYSSSATPANATEVTPVFTDVFEHNRVVINGETVRVGMPILYFKADPTARFRVDETRVPVNTVTNGDFGEYEDWTYNFLDNFPILQLPWLREIQTASPPDGLTKHYPDPENSGKEQAQIFYEQLTQRQDGSFYKPYNKNTFIFISAGYDGIYGTKDDLTSFDY